MSIWSKSHIPQDKILALYLREENMAILFLKISVAVGYFHFYYRTTLEFFY